MSAKVNRKTQFVLQYRNANYSFLRIEFGMQGYKEPILYRGSRLNLDEIGVKSIAGHSHSPNIFGGTWQVGT